MFILVKKDAETILYSIGDQITCTCEQHMIERNASLSEAINLNNHKEEIASRKVRVN